MNEIELDRIDLNLLVTFDVLMSERSVTRAADKLHRTPSAISHALNRLREQLGDPLMVRVGDRMEPGPFALGLIDDVRPILREIRRVVAPRIGFEPSSSTQGFRLAMPDFPGLVSAIIARAQAEAPGARFDWVPLPRETVRATDAGEIDLAMVFGGETLPDGLEVRDVPEETRATFLRADHPAIPNWGPDEAARWPHLQVITGNASRSPAEAAHLSGAAKRVIGARNPHFSGVAPLLARTDMIATLNRLAVHADVEAFGLRAMPPAMAQPPLRLRFIWSFLYSNDPAQDWMRRVAMKTYLEQQRAAETA
ncbi:LysR family transcriptional regulator [Albidovulum sediminis]|uniref:LysR family transcriptional regulator n=1 Tax=Albidovulum sediminis TaxID=3066345 RepID=A0ABT2NIZ1_9RHOB|nr:LysR family transcriptional regulator [Defluviimonas sediminis]MCT8328877.1 LysR family transcriptional regulator [Defluviimonas sediminis]